MARSNFSKRHLVKYLEREMRMKLHLIAVLLGLASSVQSKSSFTEVEAVPSEEITKSWRAEITLSGKLEGYAFNGANSVTLIDGFGSFVECQSRLKK